MSAKTHPSRQRSSSISLFHIVIRLQNLEVQWAIVTGINSKTPHALIFSEGLHRLLS